MIIIMFVLQVLEGSAIITSPKICVHLNVSVSVIAEQERAGTTDSYHLGLKHSSHPSPPLSIHFTY